LLSDLERDALTEILNISVGRAASNLRKMVGEQVLLSVPGIEIVSQGQAARLISECEDAELVAVCKDFSGAFSGRALLIFPGPKSLELVRAVTQNTLDPEEMTELEQEALAETGNIILNSCLATMANMLKRSISITVPVIVRGDGARLFEALDQPVSGSLVIFLYINFGVRDRDIRGYIAMLMNLPSLEVLKGLVSAFIDQVVGEDG
jgi:chemotaxis protein CheC